ncbi:MAG TPA: porin [Geminicoccus sp.]|jgi:hypothetical protein|uniref:porin n=1 Tax=Geminicoccus sp. TaxID=2024832 RepID=UPI002E325650|nr:porin [Geminicoccus sp.]HEX2529315.1 porin [Geminicoccus sp.]
MRIKTLLLAGVASGVVAAAGAASAAEVTPGGALDIKLSGQFRTGVVFGENDSISGRDPGYGFYTNNRFFIDVRGKDDGSLMEYGGRVRLRLDNGRGNFTSRTQQIIVGNEPITVATGETSSGPIIDRSWLFVRGGWGEIRFGNEVGPGDEMKVFSSTVAAGTGGVDGDFNPAFNDSPFTYTVPLSGAATKIVYYTPTLAGFQAGVSFAPDDDAGGLISQIDDTGGGRQHVEGGISYKGGFSGVDLLASVTASTAKRVEGTNDDADINGIMGGISVGFGGFNVAGAYGTNGGDVEDVDYWNVGIGGAFGPAKLSLEYATAEGADQEPTAIVASATMGLMPGLSLLADVGLYDSDAEDSDESFAGLVAIDIQF